MAKDTLTGSRIRERRIMAGLRQADLARQIGISASYLNLIEHNRRRIGGKLLLGIAQALGVEPSMLTEGAEAALIATLREAAADAGTLNAETDRADEFAGRFPGWAEVLAEAHRRIASLERTVETLSDRLAHDPQLAASLHEVLSTAAAIRSTASILVDTEELEPEWRDKFHRNINQDSQRLADSSKALVTYLDDTSKPDTSFGVPQEQAESFIAEHGYHFPDLETGTPLKPAALRQMVETNAGLPSVAARYVAHYILDQYQADAAQLPLAQFQAALADLGADPLALQSRFGVPLATILRRMAAMPADLLGAEAGLIVCDSAGSILFCKPTPGFTIPRFGASCPLWPVFRALSRPEQPIRERVEQVGRQTAQFECYSVAHAQEATRYNHDPLYQATMLIVPVAAQEQTGAARAVGTTCRVCSRSACTARREPSILREEF